MSDLGNFYDGDPILRKGISFVTANSVAEHRPEVGTRVIYKGEEYVFVHNAMASTELAQGEFAVMSSLSGYSLTKSSVQAADMPIGSVKHVTFPSGGYGWLLVRGINEVAKVESTLATGQLATIGDDGQLATYNAGTFPTGPLVAKVLSSGSSAAKVYHRCFG